MARFVEKALALSSGETLACSVGEPSSVEKPLAWSFWEPLAWSVGEPLGSSTRETLAWSFGEPVAWYESLVAGYWHWYIGLKLNYKVVKLISSNIMVYILE